MIIVRVEGTVTIDLTAEDCALLARACDEARLSDALSLRGAESEKATYEALGAAFAALGMACAARLSLSPQDTCALQAHLAEMGLTI